MAKAESTIPDPIYAAIERHRNAARLWQAAVAVRDAFPESRGTPEGGASILEAAVANARLPLVDAGLDLIETRPTTVEGFVAALEFMRDQLQDGAVAMPRAVPWVDTFVDTLANAAGDLLAQLPEATP
jgi:hypothetical protein